MAFKINPFMQLVSSASTHPVPYERWVFDQFALPEQARVLEVGCNNGQLWVDNADRVPRDSLVIVSDCEPDLVLEAARNLIHRRRNFAFMALDATDLPMELGLFDAVIANRLIHSISMEWRDRHNVIHQLRGRLKESGTLYAATNGDRDFEDLDLLVREFDDRCTFKGGSVNAFGYFCLENGEWQLSQAFGRVSTVMYDDVLEIKDADLLYKVMMLFSDSCRKHIKAPRRRRSFKRHLWDRIARDGSVRIRRSTCMFIARP